MNKEILRLAIPNILSNISVPLLGTVDTALMGRLSAGHIAAVGIGGMIFNFIYWNFGFLRMGTTGMTAQAYGAKDVKDQSTLLLQALFVGIILAIAVMILSAPLFSAAKHLLYIDDQQAVLVRDYYFIRIFDAPASMMLYGIMGWFFGMQNSIYPLVLTILINVFNIALSYVLVVYYQMDIKGVAFGTLVAQYLGVAVAFFLIRKKYRFLFNSLPEISNSFLKETRKFLTINADIFLRTICLTLAFGIFYAFSSKAGEIFLAANVVLLLFVNWMSYLIDGFAYASESLVGRYTGASEPQKTLRIIRQLFIWSAIVAVGIGGSYYLFGESLTRLFTDQSEVIKYVNEYLLWVALFPVFAFACYIWDGVFIGLTAVKAMRNAMLGSLLLYIPAMYILSHYFGNHGLWAGLLLLMIFRGGIQTIQFAKAGLSLK